MSYSVDSFRKPLPKTADSGAKQARLDCYHNNIMKTILNSQVSLLYILLDLSGVGEFNPPPLMPLDP